MSAGGTYDANSEKMRRAARELLRLAERPAQIRREFRERSADFEGWNGQADAKEDSFYEKTQPEWKKTIDSLSEQTGIEDAVHGGVYATLVTADSIDGTQGFADDLVETAKSKASSLLDGDSDDDSGYEGDDDVTGGGKH